MAGESSTVDTVVVGAGAVGSACAYFLAEAGQKVALLERAAIGSGSSTHATGYLSLISADFRDEEYLAFGVDSFNLTNRLVPTLEAATGMDLLHQQRPSMRIALDEDEETTIRGEFVWQQKYVKAQWISAEEARAIEPRLSPALRGALYEPHSAQLDSARYTLALAAAAERLGAEVVLRSATGISTSAGRVTGVSHKAGTITCASVVLAMGVWAPAAEAWSGMRIPVKPLRGERLLLRLPGSPLAAMMMSPKRGHLISRLDGNLSVGSTAGRDADNMREYLEETPSDDVMIRPSDAAMYELLERANDVLPTAIEDATVVAQLAGVRPLSPDRRAIIGPADIEGVFLATGHGTKGIHLAAVTGRLIRDLVTGQATPADIPRGTRPDRFSDEAWSDAGDRVFSIED